MTKETAKKLHNQFVHFFHKLLHANQTRETVYTHQKSETNCCVEPFCDCVCKIFYDRIKCEWNSSLLDKKNANIWSWFLINGRNFRFYDISYLSNHVQKGGGKRKQKITIIRKQYELLPKEQCHWFYFMWLVMFAHRVTSCRFSTRHTSALNNGKSLALIKGNTEIFFPGGFFLSTYIPFKIRTSTNQ